MYHKALNQFVNFHVHIMGILPDHGVNHMIAVYQKKSPS